MDKNERAKRRLVLYMFVLVFALAGSLFLANVFNKDEKERYKVYPCFEKSGCPLNKDWRYIKTYTDQDYYERNEFM
jgi:hypothetical protein